MTPIQRMRKRGYITIIDALIALIFFSFIFATLISVYEPTISKGSSTSFKEIHYVSEDALDVLNKVGVLDEVGTEWASANGSTNSSYWYNAANISRSYLDKMIPDRYGYEVVIDETNVIYDSDADNVSGRPRRKDADTTTHSSRLLVGYGKGLPTRGQVARAFLTNIREKVTSSYAYFGGFEGQGTLTKYITLPEGVDAIQNNNGICLEYDAGDDFTLKIDGNVVPGTFTKGAQSMSANYKCISGSYLTPSAGTHNFVINFTGDDLENQYISGGFIKVTYNTSEFDTSPETGKIRYEFPGINGLINMYSSFYVPGMLNSMNMHLRFQNNYTAYLTIGNARIFDSTNITSRNFCSISGNNYTCNINNTNLSQILASKGLTYATKLSEQTIPLRMGVENMTGLAGMMGTADVVLITDLSGSMDYYISADTQNGHDRNCDDPHINDPDTNRISVAKCVDIDFINKILDGSGNRVGLVGFNTVTDNWVGLTSNSASLISNVQSYSAPTNARTCLCCAINKAMSLFNDSLVLIPQGSDWKYKRNTSGCGDSCDPTILTTASGCNISGWRNFTFNDTSWATWNPVTTGDNLSALGSVVYYRKHFNVSLSLITGNPTLKIRNQRGIECYLNGNLIGKETTCGSASYWDWTWAVNKSYFNSTGIDNVLACRVRSGTSSNPTNRRGTAFDATMTASQKRYIIVMTDGVAGCSCGGCGSNPTCSNPVGVCSGSCTQTTASCDPPGGPDYECSGAPPGACTDSDCQPAINDAICSARRAYNTYFLNKMYSVGFGPVATCTNGRQTLQQIAQCGNGTYYGSSNASELKVIYDQIAEDILNTTKEAQIINVTGDMVPSILYPDSYIDFYYIPPTNYSAYGAISLTQETERFNKTSNCTGYLYIPNISKASDVKVTSYSAEHWTDYVKSNNDVVYTLRDGHFGSDYTLIGDPYIVQIPPSFVNPQGNGDKNNSIFIETGDNSTFHTNCSRDNKAIYVLRVTGRVGYGNVFAEKEGCKWTIEFEDGTTINETLPSDYNGSNTCSFTESNISYVRSDAIDDAVYRLLQNLDAGPGTPNGKIDVKFDPDMVELDFSRSGGVQSLWGPISVKLIVWDRKIR